MATFMERYRAGEIPDDQVDEVLDDEVEAWHEGAERTPLSLPVHMYEHLGMTYEEFRRWVTNPDAIYSMKERV